MIFYAFLLLSFPVTIIVAMSWANRPPGRPDDEFITFGILLWLVVLNFFVGYLLW